jgi:3-deoxy-7-phosphoheptulonate synthase
MDTLGSELNLAPLGAVRAGLFKPRTSPHSFQGLGLSGLLFLEAFRLKYKMPIISEVMSLEHMDAMEAVIDVFQVGSRNMQNFDLLRALGAQKKPVLLKRGFSATIEEFLFAAEYITMGGNPQVILCERGIRSFDTITRNVLDLGAVAYLKPVTHLPVFVDPSHATGRRELVAPMARAAVAAGADGLLIECHPQPDLSVTDAAQAISLDMMNELSRELEPLASFFGRHIPCH